MNKQHTPSDNETSRFIYLTAIAFVSRENIPPKLVSLVSHVVGDMVCCRCGFTRIPANSENEKIWSLLSEEEQLKASRFADEITPKVIQWIENLPA